MSITLEKWIEFFEELFPTIMEESWDNSGYQIMNPTKKVQQVMIAMDLTDRVLEEAIHLKADLIVTHHPFLFEGVKKIDLSTYKGKMFKKLIQNDISCMALHTNYDATSKGMNTMIADRLGLLDCRPLIPGLTGTEYDGLGGVGQLENPLSIDAFLRQVKTSFNLENIAVNGIDNKHNPMIRCIAFCGGAGGDFVSVAKKAGADVYLTGDVTHHQTQVAYENNLIIVDTSHYGMEKVFLDHIDAIMKTKDPSLQIAIYAHNDFEMAMI